MSNQEIEVPETLEQVASEACSRLLPEEIDNIQCRVCKCQFKSWEYNQQWFAVDAGGPGRWCSSTLLKLQHFPHLAVYAVRCWINEYHMSITWATWSVLFLCHKTIGLLDFALGRFCWTLAGSKDKASQVWEGRARRRFDLFFKLSVDVAEIAIGETAKHNKAQFLSRRGCFIDCSSLICWGTPSSTVAFSKDLRHFYLGFQNETQRIATSTVDEACFTEETTGQAPVTSPKRKMDMLDAGLLVW